MVFGIAFLFLEPQPYIFTPTPLTRCESCLAIVILNSLTKDSLPGSWEAVMAKSNACDKSFLGDSSVVVQSKRPASSVQETRFLAARCRSCSDNISDCPPSDITRTYD